MKNFALITEKWFPKLKKMVDPNVLEQLRYGATHSNKESYTRRDRNQLISIPIMVMTSHLNNRNEELF